MENGEVDLDVKQREHCEFGSRDSSFDVKDAALY